MENVMNTAAAINEFAYKANEKRLDASNRSASLKEANLMNDANMASKRKGDWSALRERADQIHVRQARMSLEDMEKEVRAAEAARTPRFTEGEVAEKEAMALNKGFWIGTIFTAAVGGYIAYKRIKNQRREIERLERRVEELKKK